MGPFVPSGFRGFLSTFMEPLISRDPDIAPQQRVILMGGVGNFLINEISFMTKMDEFSENIHSLNPPLSLVFGKCVLDFQKIRKM